MSKGKKTIKMEINAGLRFGNMSGLRRSSRPSQFRWMQVFFVLHKWLRTMILAGFSTIIII